METKTCTKCGVMRELGEFHKRLCHKDGLEYKCKYCEAERCRKRYCPQKSRNSKLRQKYGITQDQYSEMYDSRNGQCDICGDYHPLLQVDHCHTSLEIRGLLCPKCNKALGLLRDSQVILQSAIDYLLN